MKNSRFQGAVLLPHRAPTAARVTAGQRDVRPGPPRSTKICCSTWPLRRPPVRRWDLAHSEPSFRGPSCGPRHGNGAVAAREQRAAFCGDSMPSTCCAACRAGTVCGAVRSMNMPAAVQLVLRRRREPHQVADQRGEAVHGRSRPFPSPPCGVTVRTIEAPLPCTLPRTPESPGRVLPAAAASHAAHRTRFRCRDAM